MRTFTKTPVSGPSITWTEYTDKDIKEAWEKPQQGHHQAVDRGKDCIVVTCDEETAILFTRIFIREFAIPTCCHYDGQTLSMYCGALGEDKELLKQKLRQISIGRDKPTLRSVS